MLNITMSLAKIMKEHVISHSELFDPKNGWILVSEENNSIDDTSVNGTVDIDIGLSHVFDSEAWHGVNQILEEVAGQGTEWVMPSNANLIPRYKTTGTHKVAFIDDKIWQTVHFTVTTNGNDLLRRTLLNYYDHEFNKVIETLDQELTEQFKTEINDFPFYKTLEKIRNYNPNQQELSRHFKPWTLPFPEGTTSYLERYVNYVIQNNAQDKPNNNRVRFS